MWPKNQYLLTICTRIDPDMFDNQYAKIGHHYANVEWTA